ncbi:DUF1847 domain-containing protein [Acerihabitans sp. KWT182]|uniref:DUF1847 domain-containing protein n=1 Tax=Acerihabitans sp. KWT182 TaxID=3157919 RepID=A0AAU7Q9N3_9GAMM
MQYHQLRKRKNPSIFVENVCVQVRRFFDDNEGAAMASKFTCTECNFLNCQTRDNTFPKKCLTTAEDNESVLQDSLAIYDSDPLVNRIMHASAQVEGQYYGQLTRVEEIIVFAKKIGAKKIGVASCAGLIKENRIFASILRANGLDVFGVLCKVGGQDKCSVGIADEDKIRPGNYEAMCNPVMQAKLCNKEKTDLNVISGLCVGHDSLFIKKLGRAGDLSYRKRPGAGSQSHWCPEYRPFLLQTLDGWCGLK